MIGFGRLNHNLDFSFLHIKNPVGDFSPTGFVEQPNKKRLLTVVLLPSYTTILKSLILIRPFISLHKNGEGLLIVVCVKVAENRLLLQGKIKTLGLIFSHETAGLLASFTTISKSLIHIRTLISLHKNGEGLFIVVLVLEAMLASSTGKFET